MRSAGIKTMLIGSSFAAMNGFFALITTPRGSVNWQIAAVAAGCSAFFAGLAMWAFSHRG